MAQLHRAHGAGRRSAPTSILPMSISSTTESSSRVLTTSTPTRTVSFVTCVLNTDVSRSSKTTTNGVGVRSASSMPWSEKASMWRCCFRPAACSPTPRFTTTIAWRPRFPERTTIGWSNSVPSPPSACTVRRCCRFRTLGQRLPRHGEPRRSWVFPQSSSAPGCVKSRTWCDRTLKSPLSHDTTPFNERSRGRIPSSG